MPAAVIGASPHLASLAHEPGLAVASSIKAAAIGYVAIGWTRAHVAAHTKIPLLTHAHQVRAAAAMAAALAGTHAGFTGRPRVANHTVAVGGARQVYALSPIVAVVRARDLVADSTDETGLALTRTIEAELIARTAPGARSLGAVGAGPTLLTHALVIHTDSSVVAAPLAVGSLTRDTCVA